MKKILIALTVTFILSGCATRYHRTGLSGGFSETQLQPNVFSVHFRGNGYTNRQRSSDFAMLRCAELTLQNSFTHFVIADSSQTTKTAMYNTGGSSQTYGSVNKIGNTSYGSFNTTHSGGTSIPINKPSSSYTIICFKEKPKDNAMVFDATFLANSLRRKYKIETNLQATSRRPSLTLEERRALRDEKRKTETEKRETQQ